MVAFVGSLFLLQKTTCSLLKFHFQATCSQKKKGKTFSLSFLFFTIFR
ncbi:hypothetical protein CU040_1765 [Enterococcus faecium]|nr:hypothetical protein [Enterococcus faecium]